MTAATVHEWCSAAVVMVTTGEEAGKVVRGSERMSKRERASQRDTVALGWPVVYVRRLVIVAGL